MDTEDLAAEFFAETCNLFDGGFLAYVQDAIVRFGYEPEFVLTPDQWQRASLFRGVDPADVEKRCTQLLRAALRD